MHESEPEARPLRLGREERLEHVGNVARCDALAGIADHDLEPLAATATRSSPPSGIASTAFKQRFQRIWRNCWASTGQSTDGENSRSTLRLPGLARCSSSSNTSSAAAATSKVAIESGAGRAYSRKFLMMWLSRSDSRATI